MNLLTNNGFGIKITGDSSIKILGEVDYFGNKTTVKTDISGVEKVPIEHQNGYIQACLNYYGKKVVFKKKTWLEKIF